MKATIFAANGQVTAIAFAGEALNFNGIAVDTVEASAEDFEAALLAKVPSGVGSPWPPIQTEVSENPVSLEGVKPTKAPKK